MYGREDPRAQSITLPQAICEPHHSQKGDVTLCGLSLMSLLGGQKRKSRPCGGMSALPPVSEHRQAVSQCPKSANRRSHTPRRHGRTPWMRWSFGQPGLPQSLVSQLAGHFRSTSTSRQGLSRLACLAGANTRHPLLHSISSSARVSSDDGMVNPSAFAVLRLIANWYFVGACAGRSAGFSPLKMRST